MTDSAQEKDLEKLQAALNEEARSAMDAMRIMAEEDAESLKASGHKTNEGAVFSTFKYYRKRMDDLVKAHIRKYPD